MSSAAEARAQAEALSTAMEVGKLSMLVESATKLAARPLRCSTPARCLDGMVSLILIALVCACVPVF